MDCNKCGRETNGWGLVCKGCRDERLKEMVDGYLFDPDTVSGRALQKLVEYEDETNFLNYRLQHYMRRCAELEKTLDKVLSNQT